jgi:Tfp pilus assembly protein PilV
MKTTLPWIVVIVLIAGVGLLYSANQRQAAELARWQQTAAEAEKARPATEEAGKATVDSAETAQLRKDHEELMRLRNEVRQLREEKQQLTKQLQAAQQAAVRQQELQAALSEVQQLRSQATQAEKNSQLVVCVNNLKQIDAAKLQWSVENNRPAGAIAVPQDLMPYFPNKAFPTCPGGGAYTINPIGQSPTCNLPGHILPK